MQGIRNSIFTAACLAGLALILTPAPASADFVIADDLIVDGSACIGFDCVNGEAFSFDTVRLKENNLRLTFIDTSVASSFPRGDWQLRANDSANGGLNRFSIDWLGTAATSGNGIDRTPFTIEGNAPSHSLYVDDGGRLGLGTSVPSVEVHIKDGDTPTLRLEQDNSSGFEPQTWDVAGNETNFFIRDVTNGSTLPLRIRPTAPSNTIFMDTTGDIGMGTSAPDRELHVRRTDANATTVLIENANAAGQNTQLRLLNGQEQWDFRNNTVGDFTIVVGGATQVMEIDNGGNNDVTFAGEIFTSGSCAIGCDAVFSPEYLVESIEEHGEAMWTNRHLPAVGPTSDEGPINLSRKTTGMLNELEKAHIYIEQLNERVKELEAVIATLTASP